MRLTEEDFSQEAFPARIAAGDFPQGFPLSYKVLQDRLTNARERHLHTKKTFRHSDKSYELVTRDDKIVIPKSLKRKVTECATRTCRILVKATGTDAQAAFHLYRVRSLGDTRLQGMQRLPQPKGKP